MTERHDAALPQTLSLQELERLREESRRAVERARADLERIERWIRSAGTQWGVGLHPLDPFEVRQAREMTT